jgi:hypothetical protein
MKVRELIERLGKLNAPDLDVLGYSEDTGVPVLFHLESTDISKAVVQRGVDGVVRPRFDNEEGHRIVFVNLTTDF